jgi:hypothetical protein
VDHIWILFSAKEKASGRRPFKTATPYFFAGAGAGAGVDAGCEVLVFWPERIEPPAELRDEWIDNVMEVTIKMMADHVVNLVNKVAPAAGPKAVWLPPEVNIERSPPLPLCTSTTRIRKSETST